MRAYLKLLATMLVAVSLQALVAGAGGWEEVWFDAQCLVLDCRPDPALQEHLIHEANRLRRAQSDAVAARRHVQATSRPVGVHVVPPPPPGK
jgi:hypothetical protein